MPEATRGERRTRTSRARRAVVALRATTRWETSEADMVMEAILTCSGGVSSGRGAPRRREKNIARVALDVAENARRLAGSISRSEAKMRRVVFFFPK
jgi:hypothetical protein